MLLVLIVAVANLCVGYALAAHLAPGGYDPILSTLGRWVRLPDLRREPVDTSEGLLPVEERLVEQRLDPASRDVNEPTREKSVLETALEELSGRLEAYRLQLSEADTQLHGATERPAITSIVEHLAPSHHQCQQALNAAAQVLASAAVTTDGQPIDLGAAISDYLQEYVQQIEAVERRLTRLNPTDDTTAVVAKAREQVGQLLETSFELRDQLTETQTSVAEQEGRLGAVGRRARSDRELTTLSRTGLEEELWCWWQNDPQRQRQLSLLAIDVDHCRRINGAYGAATGDRALWGVARILDEEIRGEDRLARFSGQRFVALLPDTGPHNAAALAERLRQRIESCTFQFGELNLNITVSCGATEARSKDDIGTLLERLGEATREAKQSGRNRTCVHDGKIVSPVLPPSLRFAERTMAL